MGKYDGLVIWAAVLDLILDLMIYYYYPNSLNFGSFMFSVKLRPINYIAG